MGALIFIVGILLTLIIVISILYKQTKRDLTQYMVTVEKMDTLNKELIHKLQILEIHNKELIVSHHKGLKTQSGEVAGKILEKLLPFFVEYPYDTRDIIPIYDTFDFIVLNGRCNDNITEVVIQDVKTGQSSLSKKQLQLRDCIQNGAVRFEVWKRNNKKEHFYCVAQKGGNNA